MARIMLEVEAEYQGIVEAVSELLDTVRMRRQEATNQTSIDYAQVEKEVAQGAAAVERACHASDARGTGSRRAGGDGGRQAASASASLLRQLLHDGGAGEP